MCGRWTILGLLLVALAGCGTTRWTDTARTATEQLLISDAIDRAVSQIDLKALAGRKVFLDSAPLAMAVDSPYLVSSLRQHMLASGCILKDVREEADFIVEARAGAVGTDKQELMFGVPSVNVPAVPTSPVPASSIPEIPIVKRTQQRAVAKIALFAYNAKTGRPVWQSGIVPVESTAKDIWVVGAGPFQRGSIYRGTKLAGNPFDIPLIEPGDKDADRPSIPVADEAFFTDAAKSLARNEPAGSPPADDPAEEAPSSVENASASSHGAEGDHPVLAGVQTGAAPEPAPCAATAQPAAHTAPAPAESPSTPTPTPPRLTAPNVLLEEPDRVPLPLPPPLDAAPLPYRATRP
ncbi:MAG: hypothetical protein JW809_01580 [Pirellulales bacterium]|nr:hypothetical protein [Pirellulales bacterium]